MTKKAYLAGGCFWGLEDLFRSQPGVLDVVNGYTGGQNDGPNYENHPGHAEAIEAGAGLESSVRSLQEWHGI